MVKKPGLGRFTIRVYACALLRWSHRWDPTAVHTVIGHITHPTLLPYYLTIQVTMFYLLKVL